MFLAWKGLDAPVEVEPQKLTAPERAGFTAVEWGRRGGSAMKKLLLLLALTLLAAGLAGCGNSSGNVAVPEKPVLYLYPEEEMEVTVTLDFDGTLTSTYPAYGDGWTVTARPDGTLTNPATGREYYCLFWEGITEAEYDFSTGFCVAGGGHCGLPGGRPGQAGPDRAGG